MGKTRVLFLCTGNSARSQMGEALLRKYAGDHFEVHSAGTDPKGVNPYTVRVLEEIGIDTSGFTSDSLRSVRGQGGKRGLEKGGFPDSSGPCCHLQKSMA